MRREQSTAQLAKHKQSAASPTTERRLLASSGGEEDDEEQTIPRMRGSPIMEQSKSQERSRLETPMGARKRVADGEGDQNDLDEEMPEEEPEQPEGTHFVHGQWKRFALRSLYCLGRDNKFRKALIWLVEWRWFEYFITTLIIINSILLGIYDYKNPDAPSLRNTLVDKSELVFTILFTIECTLKILAMGFICERGCYLRDAWNWLDFIVVVTSLLQFLIPANVSVLRTFRLIRPLRSLSSVPSMRLLVSTLISSLWQLGSILALALFFFTVFAILGVSLWQGEQHYICRATPEPQNGQWLPIEPSDRLCGGSYSCPSGSTCGSIIQASDKFFISPDIDLYADTKTEQFLYGYTTFDNFPLAFLTIFQSVTLEGWTTVMYFIGDAYNIYISAIYFVFCIIICSYFLLNLTVAVMLENFSELNKSEDLYNKKIEKMLRTARIGLQAQIFVRMMTGNLAAKQALKQSQTLKNQEKAKEQSKVSPASTPPPSPPAVQRFPAELNQVMEEVPEEEGKSVSLAPGDAIKVLPISSRRTSSQKLRYDTERAKGEHESVRNTDQQEEPEDGSLPLIHESAQTDLSKNFKAPHPCRTFFFGKPEDVRAPFGQRYYDNCCTKAFYCLVNTPLFNYFIFLFIIINTIVLSLDRYPAPPIHEQKVVQILNLCFTTIFTLELICKIIGFGFLTYIRDSFNILDAIVVLFSLIELILQDGGNVVSSLRALRLLRIMKLARSWESLRLLINSIMHTVTSIGPFTILLGLFIYVAALMGMQFFAGKVPGPPRANFDELHHAIITIFIVLVGQNWNEVMFDTANAVGWGASVYFCMLVVLGNFIMLNLFLAILLGNFEEARNIMNNIKKLEKEQIRQARRHGRLSILARRKKSGRQSPKPGSGTQHTARKKMSQKISQKLVDYVSSQRQLKTYQQRSQHLPTPSLQKIESITKMRDDQNLSRHEPTRLCKTEQIQANQSDSFAKISVKNLTLGRDKPLNIRALDTLPHFMASPRPDKAYESSRTQNSALVMDIGKSRTLQPKMSSSCSEENSRVNPDYSDSALFVKAGHLAVSPQPERYHTEELHSRSQSENVAKFLKGSGGLASSLMTQRNQEQPITQRAPSRNQGTRSYQPITPQKKDVTPRQLMPSVPASSKRSSRSLFRLSKDSGLAHEKMSSLQVPEEQIQPQSDQNKTLDSKLEPVTAREDKVITPREPEQFPQSQFGKVQEEQPEQEEPSSPVAPSNKTEEAPQICQEKYPENQSKSCCRYLGECSLFLFHKDTKFRKGIIILTQPLKIPEGLDTTKGMALGDEQGFTQEREIQPYDSPPLSLSSPQLTAREVQQNLAKRQERKAKLEELRKYKKQKVVNQCFEYGVLVLIIASSITIAIDNPLNDPNSSLSRILFVIDSIFTFLFLLEAVLKIIATGFIKSSIDRKPYLCNGWNILDFIVVIASLIDFSMGVSGISTSTLKALKALRTIRALRPLRVISRNQGLKLVVNALISSIPPMINVLMVCLLFVYIFAILGTNFFKGTFYSCKSDPALSMQDCPAGEWSNAMVHFDTSLDAMLTLFEMLNLEGWTDVMWNGIDAAGVGKAPIRDKNPWYSLFFIAFIIVGNMFLLNLFVGVVIDNFNQMKEKLGGYFWLTAQQKKWVEMQRLMIRMKLKYQARVPTSAVRKLAYKIVTSSVFQGAIVICIVVNTLVMALMHYRINPKFEYALEIVNYFFAIVFTLECLLKLLGLGKSYFYSKWNIFDFIIVVGTNLGLLFKVAGSSINIGAAATGVRAFRIMRAMRLINQSKHLRVILDTLVYILPSLANIGSMICLLIFIYSVLGMSFFAQVKYRPEGIGELRDYANFRSFGSAMLLLFRCATGESWNLLMHELADSSQPCKGAQTFEQRQTDGIQGCGSAIAYPFFISFMVLISLMIMNLFVTVVIEGFEESRKEDEDSIINSRELEVLLQKWASYDPRAKGWIRPVDLAFLLYDIEEPLGYKKKQEYILRRKTTSFIYQQSSTQMIKIGKKIEATTQRASKDLTMIQKKMKRSSDDQVTTLRKKFTQRQNQLEEELRELDKEMESARYRNHIKVKEAQRKELESDCQWTNRSAGDFADSPGKLGANIHRSRVAPLEEDQSFSEVSAKKTRKGLKIRDVELATSQQIGSRPTSDRMLPMVDRRRESRDSSLVNVGRVSPLLSRPDHRASQKTLTERSGSLMKELSKDRTGRIKLTQSMYPSKFGTQVLQKGTQLIHMINGVVVEERRIKEILKELELVVYWRGTGNFIHIRDVLMALSRRISKQKYGELQIDNQRIMQKFIKEWSRKYPDLNKNKKFQQGDSKRYWAAVTIQSFWRRVRIRPKFRQIVHQVSHSKKNTEEFQPQPPSEIMQEEGQTLGEYIKKARPLLLPPMDHSSQSIKKSPNNTFGKGSFDCSALRTPPQRGSLYGESIDDFPPDHNQQVFPSKN